MFARFLARRRLKRVEAALEAARKAYAEASGRNDCRAMGHAAVELRHARNERIRALVDAGMGGAA